MITPYNNKRQTITITGILMRYPLFIVTLFFTSISFGQSITRQYNESVESFVNRLRPDSMVLAHAIIETNTWDTATKAIIALYGYDDPRDPNTGFNKISGHIYLPVGQNRYREISFGPIEEDGGYPEILSVFFSNADKDKSKELVVLCKYEQQHYDYGGVFYGTFIFDNPSQRQSLAFFKKLSNKFLGCDCGGRDGRKEKAKFKTAEDVKAGLKKMRF
jgi:hypothetical protein